MIVTRTENPPLIRQDDRGQWVIELALAGGQDVVQAEIGDGAWLLQQIVEKIVLPRMRSSIGLTGRSDIKTIQDVVDGMDWVGTGEYDADGDKAAQEAWVRIKKALGVE